MPNEVIRWFCHAGFLEKNASFLFVAAVSAAASWRGALAFLGLL